MSSEAPSQRRSSAANLSMDSVRDSHEEADGGDSVLLAALNGSEMPNAVAEWLTRYQEDANDGIMELINLILEVRALLVRFLSTPRRHADASLTAIRTLAVCDACSERCSVEC
eukprot:SAG11_NODE_4116_length_2059_cov_1.488265_1_plen_113_part_00